MINQKVGTFDLILISVILIFLQYIHVRDFTGVLWPTHLMNEHLMRASATPPVRKSLVRQRLHSDNSFIHRLLAHPLSFFFRAPVGKNELENVDG